MFYLDEEGNLRGKTDFENAMKMDTPSVMKALRKYKLRKGIKK